MAKFDYKKWVTENKHGPLKEQVATATEFCPCRWYNTTNNTCDPVGAGMASANPPQGYYNTNIALINIGASSLQGSSALSTPQAGDIFCSGVMVGGVGSINTGNINDCTGNSGNYAQVVISVGGGGGSNQGANRALLDPSTSCGFTGGCMDSNSPNYNPSATVDDGSCLDPVSNFGYRIDAGGCIPCAQAHPACSPDPTCGLGNETFNCFNWSHGVPMHICVPAGQNGTYSSFQDCQSAISNGSCAPDTNQGPTESYNCVGNTCIDPGDGTGQYSTLTTCQQGCTPIDTNLDTNQGGNDPVLDMEACCEWCNTQTGGTPPTGCHDGMCADCPKPTKPSGEYPGEEPTKQDDRIREIKEMKNIIRETIKKLIKQR